jgi:COP9 signalosome complex subunit 3
MMRIDDEYGDATRAAAHADVEKYVQDVRGNTTTSSSSVGVSWWDDVDAASARAMGDEVDETNARWSFADAVTAAYARTRHRDGGFDEEMTNADDEAMNDDVFVRRVVDMCQRANREKVQRDARAFASCCRVASELACEGRGDGPAACVPAMRRAVMLAQDGRIEACTPQHACYLRVCLKAKMYDDVKASNLASTRMMFEADPALTGLTATDFLLTCYYGGRVLLGLRKYDDAAVEFMNAVAAPATTVSAVAVAAYKKYVLSRLLSKSAYVPELPNYVSAPVRRYVASSECEAYAALAQAFASGKIETLRETIAAHRDDAFTRDENVGLVDLLEERAQMVKMYRLAQTYSTLSLEDVARLLSASGVDAAESLVRRMVRSGDVAAKIDGVEGVVRFLDQSEIEDERIAEKLQRCVDVSNALESRVRDENETYLQSRKYISNVVSAALKKDGVRRME